MMGRIIAIDYGKKRVGIAVTDPLQIIAYPFSTISAGETEKFLLDYCSSESVDEFVIGYPTRLNNQPSESVKYIDPFIKRLRKLFPGKPINLVDERFTSSIARRSMLEGGAGKEARRDKGSVDRISASLILQSYLERRSNINQKS